MSISDYDDTWVKKCLKQLKLLTRLLKNYIVKCLITLRKHNKESIFDRFVLLSGTKMLAIATASHTVSFQ